MKHMIIAVAVTTLSLEFAPSLLAGDSPAETASKPAESAKTDQGAEEKVCRRIHVIGSRLGTKKICATAAEWQEIRRGEAEDAAEARQQSGKGS